MNERKDVDFYEESYRCFENDIKNLVNKHKIAEGLAACYLCNWEDTYICHTHNNGCKHVNTCRHIRDMEINHGS